VAVRSPLDEAYERLGRWGFDEPNGFVNHGPMVCEALAVLGRDDEVESWSHDPGTPPVLPVDPGRFAWSTALGDAARTGEWIGFFERQIADEGWEAVAATWLPRLSPALGWALGHGAIRTAHALRAIGQADTPARRAELARALGYWAGGFAPGETADRTAVGAADDPGRAVVEAAADAARRYRTGPTIIALHAVTLAMAVDLFMPHLGEAAAIDALAQLRAEQHALSGHLTAFRSDVAPAIGDATLIEAAVASGEAHAVKLVEACLRARTTADDPAFALAAERVVRRGLRALGGAP
jgi:hypothetical protein